MEEKTEFEDPFIPRLSMLYQAYWRTSLLEPVYVKKARKRLKSGLGKLAMDEGRKVSFWERFIPGIGKLERFISDAAIDLVKTNTKSLKPL